MYHWITDRKTLGSIKAVCSDSVNQLIQAVNNEGLLIVSMHLVGTGAGNLIIQNADLPVGIDFNLEIVRAVGYDVGDCAGIREYVRNKFNEVMSRAGWDDCGDSPFALTALRAGDDLPGSRLSLSIVMTESDGKWYRLIHQKAGPEGRSRCFWEEVRSSSGLECRVRWLKENNFWQEVREAYLEKMNELFSDGGIEPASLLVYTEAVNGAFWKHACRDRP